MFYSLSTGLEGFSGNLFANLRGRGIASAVIKETCPPEFTISWNKESTGSPVSVITTDPIIIINDSPNTDESELDTSGDSGRGEHAHQMTPNNVYRNGSLIPNEGGELIAAIHQSIL